MPSGSFDRTFFVVYLFRFIPGAAEAHERLYNLPPKLASLQIRIWTSGKRVLDWSAHVFV